VTAVDGQVAESARDRSAHVLRTLKGYRGLTDGALAVRINASRSKVQGYVAGTSQLTIGLMYDFAQVLDVDPAVFLMEPDEALRWTIDNRPNSASSAAAVSEQPRRRSGCLVDSAA
jgi:transcriptional regulator with XRE-family HTH domain